MCMYCRIEDSPLDIGDWRCSSVYVNVPHEPPRPYDDAVCRAVLQAINVANAQPDTAAFVLLGGGHAHGHPLPAVFSVLYNGFRVDLIVYPHNGHRHLWARVYRNYT